MGRLLHYGPRWNDRFHGAPVVSRRSSIPGASDLIPKAWVFATAAETGRLTKQEKRAFEALCKRLGILSGLGDLAKWVIVGALLASEQREFKKKRGRGRPSVGKSNVDYQRVKAINAKRRKLMAAGRIGRASDASLIRELVGSDHRLFPKTVGFDALAASVSRGNKIWREFEVFGQRLQKRIAARERARKEREARSQEEKRKKDEEWAARYKGGMFDLLSSSEPSPDSAPDSERTCD